MAKHVVTTLTSDLSGKPVDDDGGSVTLSYNGKEVEIDLTGPEIDKLDKALSQYFEKGRRVRTGGRAPAKTASGGKRDKSELAEIRTWARANGWPDLGDRGRIAAEVEEAYSNAH